MFVCHFPTKEDFALAVLERRVEELRDLAEKTLGNTKRGPRERLDSYLKALIDLHVAQDGVRRCLVGELTREAPKECLRLRERLAAVNGEWLQTVTGVVKEARRHDVLAVKLPVNEVSAFLLASWQGANTQAVAENNKAPMERFRKILVTTLFSAS